MVIGPYLRKPEPENKLVEVEERLKGPIEEATINCEKSLYQLEKYSNIGFTPGYLNKIPPDVLKAKKSFTELKYYIGKLEYSLEDFKYGSYIEHNLKKLQRKVHEYEFLESTLGKIVAYGGFASIIGSLFGTLACSHTGSVAFGVTVGIVSFGMVIVAPATEHFEKNYFTYLIQRSHQSPINNIITYSDLFFNDLREKLKANK